MNNKPVHMISSAAVSFDTMSTVQTRGKGLPQGRFRTAQQSSNCIMPVLDELICLTSKSRHIT